MMHDILALAGLLSGAICFICILIGYLFLPLAISEKKKKEGYEWSELIHIPTVYKLSWYEERYFWVRKLIIFGQVGFFASIISAFILYELSKILFQ